MASTIEHPALPRLKEQFPEAGLKVAEFREMVTLLVPAAHVHAVLRFLKDQLGFDMLCDLAGVDYMGFAGATHRFAVIYSLTSIERNERLWIKVHLDPTQDTSPGSALRDEDVLSKGDPALRLPSVTDIWPGAEWMEREVYDLFGIAFTNHPDFRRILTWNGFGSHPLRKDYPLRGIGEREDYKIVRRDDA